jgi:hypothetical protein
MIRDNVKYFEEIPNVGKATAKDFLLIGIKEPIELAGKDPYKLFEKLCDCTSIRHDPCVIDVFISAVKYMEGGSAKKWWEFTAERKSKLNINL